MSKLLTINNPMVPLLAFRRQVSKTKLLDALWRHKKADQYRKGTYWDEEHRRGCAVGCCIHEFAPGQESHHELAPKLFGLPTWTFYLQDFFFEHLDDDWREWPMAFVEAIPEGADLAGFDFRYWHRLLTADGWGIQAMLKRLGVSGAEYLPLAKKITAAVQARIAHEPLAGDWIKTSSSLRADRWTDHNHPSMNTDVRCAHAILETLRSMERNLSDYCDSWVFGICDKMQDALRECFADGRHRSPFFGQKWHRNACSLLLAGEFLQLARKAPVPGGAK